MKIQLQCIDASSSMPLLQLEELPAQMGRSPEARVCINDSWASRLHCELSVQDRCLIVRDLHSRNGTYLNQERITCQGIQSGDRLTVGITTFEVSFDAAEISRDASPPANPWLTDPIAC